jgi:hypothetical protein
MAAVENHGDSQRSAFTAPCLGDIHAPDRQGLERLDRVLHPVSQPHLGLRGEHHLAVHARRQATGVALRHPPHAQERVRARTKHQLLQTTDPSEVPRLRHREDPLPQTAVRRPQPDTSRSGTSRRSRPLVRSPRLSSRRPTCPRVPRGFGHLSSSQAHLTASARFRVQAPSPVSDQLSETTTWRKRPYVPVSRRLSATGVRFSVIRYPPGNWALLTVGLPNTPKGAPGPRRGYHVPHARTATGVDAPLYPEDGSAPPGPRDVLSQRLPLHGDQSFDPAPTSILRATHYEASTRVQTIHPSGLPPACDRPDGTSRH